MLPLMEGAILRKLIVLGKHPLSVEELKVWNQTHEGDWQQVHELFLCQIKRTINGTTIYGLILSNDEARAYLVALEATPLT